MEQDKPVDDAKAEKRGLWNRNFLVLWVGLVQSAFGDAFLAIGLMWFVLERTNSPLAAATLLILGGLPKAFGPLAGAIVDRSNKKYLMIGCDVLRGLLLIGLFGLHLQNLLHLYFLYAVAALEGVLGLFYKPSLRVVLPTLVDDEKLPAANSAVEAGQHIATILGVALAGVSLAVVGAPTALMIDGVTFLLAALAIQAVRFPAAMMKAEETRIKVIVRDMVEGFRYLGSSTELVLLTVIVFSSNLVLSPVNVIFPVFSREVLGAGVRGFGFLSFGVATGLLVGSIVAGNIIGDRVNYRWTIFLGLSGLGIALVGLSLTGSLWLAALIAGVLGAVAIIIQIPLVSHLQRTVPQKLQGRIFGTMGSLVALATPLGAAIFGQALEKIAVPQVFQLAAAGCLAVAMVWWVMAILRRAAGGKIEEPEVPTTE